MLLGLFNSPFKMASEKVLWHQFHLCLLCLLILVGHNTALVGFWIWKNFQWSNESRANHE